MASETTLEIIISPDDVKDLKKSDYNLCLTKDTLFGGEVSGGNIVFNHVLCEALGPNITFKWKAQYQVYGVTGLNRGVFCDAIVKTDPVNIEGGQDATLVDGGGIYISGAYSDGKPFQIHNQWIKSARVGAKMYDSVGKKFSPIFVSPELLLHSTNELLPSQKYSVFFGKLKTGDAVGKTSTTPFHFDLPDHSEITLSYTDGTWKLGK